MNNKRTTKDQQRNNEGTTRNHQGTTRNNKDRESFLYIRHGLASVGANNVFAKCVLANCEKRSLLGNCQPSVNREGSCASLWWRWSCLDRSEPGGDRAPLTHRHPHTMRITPSSSRQNIFIVPSMLLSTWLVGPGQHLQTFYKEIWHLQKKNPKSTI